MRIRLAALLARRAVLPAVGIPAQSTTRAALEARQREAPTTRSFSSDLPPLRRVRRSDGALRLPRGREPCPGRSRSELSPRLLATPRRPALRGDCRADSGSAATAGTERPGVRDPRARSAPRRDRLRPDSVAPPSSARSRGKSCASTRSARRATSSGFRQRGRQRVIVGIRVDATRRHLWATVDDPRAFGDPTVRGGSHSSVRHRVRTPSGSPRPGDGGVQ